MNISTKKQLRYTLSTQQLEKMNPDLDTIKLCFNMKKGKISADKAVEEVIKNTLAK